MFSLVQHHIARFWEDLRTEQFEAAAEYLAPRFRVAAGASELPLEGRAVQAAYLKDFLGEMQAVGLAQSRHEVVSVTLLNDTHSTAKTRVTTKIRGSTNQFETGLRYCLIAPGGAQMGIEAVRCGANALHANADLQRCA